MSGASVEEHLQVLLPDVDLHVERHREFVADALADQRVGLAQHRHVGQLVGGVDRQRRRVRPPRPAHGARSCAPRRRRSSRRRSAPRPARRPARRSARARRRPRARSSRPRRAAARRRAPRRRGEILVETLGDRDRVVDVGTSVAAALRSWPACACARHLQRVLDQVRSLDCSVDARGRRHPACQGSGTPRRGEPWCLTQVPSLQKRRSPRAPAARTRRPPRPARFAPSRPPIAAQRSRASRAELVEPLVGVHRVVMEEHGALGVGAAGEGERVRERGVAPADVVGVLGVGVLAVVDQQRGVAGQARGRRSSPRRGASRSAPSAGSWSGM